jgi:hypothetical protein
MAQEEVIKELPRNQKRIADDLGRNFLIVLGLAFVAEALLRIFPSFLADQTERQWLEWLLVSLVGVSAYLLWNVAIWYARPARADFVKYRPWYRATAARGPVIALIIMMALTNINFNVSIPESQDAGAETSEQAEGQVSTFDFGIDIGGASETVLLVVAFLLGFFSRLAKSVLEKIAEFIFGSVYRETYKDELEAQKDSEEDGD